MFRKTAIILLICLPLLAFGQNQAKSSPGEANASLSAGAALLFKDVKTKASAAEKNRLYQQLSLKLSPDRKSLMLDEYPVSTYVYPTDLNKDGQEELFIGLGSAALFGNVGESFSLFMQDKSGVYQLQEDYSGSGRPLVLSAMNLGYPDLVPGGPGFTHPAYRWNGKSYKLHRQVKDGTLNDKNSTDIEAYSKAYAH